MSDEEQRLQRQIADIGTRYLVRTLGELPQLRALLCDARDGTPDALKSLERMAHKIHGSGAMFGFEEISERAEDLERLAAAGSGDPEHLQQLEASIGALEAEVNKQARAQGVQ